MKEEQIQGEITTADLQREFGADKTEVAAQLDQKFLQPHQQALMQIGLGMLARQTEELDHISVAEYLQCGGV